MSSYARALKAYLESPDALNQFELGQRASCTQASISRYSTGERFPDAATATAISKATEDKVPLETWRRVAAERAGLDLGGIAA